MNKKINRTYNAHETDQMLHFHGAILASFRRRAGAFVIDFFIAFACFTGLLVIGDRAAKGLGIAVGNVTLQFDFNHWYSLVFLVAYFTLLNYWTNGRSLGKRLFGIRVVSLVNGRMTLWNCLERALGYGASFLEFGFGFFQYFIHPNRCTVHDRIAETIVIKEPARPAVESAVAIQP